MKGGLLITDTQTSSSVNSFSTVEKAMSLYRKGYNSSQSILFAFSDKIGMDQEDALKNASAFGYGLGTVQSVCGIITGAAMVIGNYYYSKEEIFGSRQLIFEKTQAFIKTFEKKFQSVKCLDLVGVDFHEPGGLQKVRESEIFNSTCKNMISFACVLLEKILRQEN